MGFWHKGIEKISNRPSKEWVKGVRNTMERNGEANVTTASDGSVTRAHAAIVCQYACMCVYMRVWHCGARGKEMQGSCDA